MNQKEINELLTVLSAAAREAKLRSKEDFIVTGKFSGRLDMYLHDLACGRISEGIIGAAKAFLSKTEK